MVRFFSEAADDPAVVSIQLTLYRVGEPTPIVDALLRARAAGKEVVLFVELKARFDESRNIAWVQRLEDAGVSVVYGVVGLKNHAKVALVLRRDGDGLRRYVHIGTGNYNAATARQYTDLGLFSADPELGADIHDFFNELTGSSHPPAGRYRHLAVAPITCFRGCSNGSSVKSSMPARADRPESAPRSTAWRTRRSSRRSTGPRRPA